jgi:hypothetical protein
MLFRSVAAPFAVAMALGCQSKPAPHHDALVGDAAALSGAEEGCLDRWLSERHLDSFGSPQGTSYGGATPLFDEADGKTSSRADYVYARHPDAQRACGRDH